MGGSVKKPPGRSQENAFLKVAAGVVIVIIEVIIIVVVDTLAEFAGYRRGGGDWRWLEGLFG